MNFELRQVSSDDGTGLEHIKHKSCTKYVL